MTPKSEVVRRLCVAVDVRGYGRADDLHQRSIQRDLLEVLDEAAETVGLDRLSWSKQPGGDSEFAVLPADVREVVVVDGFLRKVASCLASHNRQLRVEARLRLRVAVHFGRLLAGANGYAGPAPVELGRLLDSDPLRDALEGNPVADMAALFSARVFEDLVKPGHTTFRAAEFTPVTVEKKEYRDTAWLWVPGGTAEANGRPPATSGTEAPASPRDDVMPTGASVHNTFNETVAGQNLNFGFQNR